jgi:histidyl-tRNA synthetase
LKPDEWSAIVAARESLAETYSLFGYQGVDVPILEHTELYRRKAGANVISQIYSFTDRGGRSVCLRPEFTASIVRFYAARKSDLPSPARLHYSGPAFRYEKPKRGTYRQFTESGVELIGVDGPTADAEIIELAIASLEKLRVRQFDVVLGHLGILSEFLSGLGLSERSESLLRESIDSIQRSDSDIGPLRSRLQQAIRDPVSGASESTPKQLDGILHRVPDLQREDVRTIISSVLAELEMTPGDGRDPSEIVDRLLTKLTRSNEMERMGRALDFIERLAKVVDRPEIALEKTRSLLAEFDLSSKPLDYVEEMFEELDAAGVDTGCFTFNPALGRGLQYYSGIVFEIFASDAKSSFQVCGGGRYNDLVEILSGPPSVPAVGFTFGIERLLMAMDDEGSATAQNPSHVLVTTVQHENRSYAAEVASMLRSAGLKTERDLKGLGIASNLASADCAEIPVVVVLGDREVASRKASLRILATGKKKTADVNVLADEIWAAIHDRKS